MRLVEFEETDNDTIVEFIVNNCQSYLAQNPKLIPMFHGEYGLQKHVVIRQIHNDRQPEASPLKLHNFLNDIIDKAGCEANRSNSLFCSGDYDQATTYGRVFVVFPIGDFSFTWSHSIRDAFVNLYNSFYVGDFYNLIKVSGEKIDSNNFEQFKKLQQNYFKDIDHNNELNGELVNKLTNSYSCSNIEDALSSHKEIMIKTDKALMIDMKFYAETTLKSLILDKRVK